MHVQLRMDQKSKNLLCCEDTCALYREVVWDSWRQGLVIDSQIPMGRHADSSCKAWEKN